MKRVTTILASLLLFSGIEANAEGFLIKGGLTFQSFSDFKTAVEDLSVKGFTQWEAGLGYQTGSVAGFCFQPELLYKAKGVKIENEIEQASIKMSYLEVPLNIQWGLELFVTRPFIFVSPYFGFNLGNKVDGTKALGEVVKEIATKFEYGLGLGLGLEISKFQITAKYNWDFGGVASWSEYWEEVKNVKTSEGMVEVAIAFIF